MVDFVGHILAMLRFESGLAMFLGVDVALRVNEVDTDSFSTCKTTSALER
jgi:hypothetical protein